MDITKVKPFLKWAGGKTQLLPKIENKVPFSKLQKFTYIEPFVGSGAVLFHFLNRFSNMERAIINDLNTDLINCYKVIKADVEKLIILLTEYEKIYNQLLEYTEKRKNFFYDKRAEFNTRSGSKVRQASLFIFLNRTCFNGLYRVNKSNIFNVPQGSYKKPKICNAENLRLVADILQKVEILNGDFKETLQFANDKSFFYFDPPYKPISKTSSFTSYTKGCFDDNEQIRLKNFCDQIRKKGSHWLLSNSDMKSTDNALFFNNLYDGSSIEKVKVMRMINAFAMGREQVKELLIGCS